MMRPHEPQVRKRGRSIKITVTKKSNDVKLDQDIVDDYLFESSAIAFEPEVVKPVKKNDLPIAITRTKSKPVAGGQRRHRGRHKKFQCLSNGLEIDVELDEPIPSNEGFTSSKQKDHKQPSPKSKKVKSRTICAEPPHPQWQKQPKRTKSIISPPSLYIPESVREIFQPDFQGPPIKNVRQLAQPPNSDQLHESPKVKHPTKPRKKKKPKTAKNLKSLQCPAGFHCVHLVQQRKKLVDNVAELRSADIFLKKLPKWKWNFADSDHSDAGYEQDNSDENSNAAEPRGIRCKRKRTKDKKVTAGSAGKETVPDISQATVSLPWMSAVPPFGLGEPLSNRGDTTAMRKKAFGKQDTSAFRGFVSLRNRRSYLHVQTAWQIYYDSIARKQLTGKPPKLVEMPSKSESTYVGTAG